jgi:hypothetical protein
MNALKATTLIALGIFLGACSDNGSTSQSDVLVPPRMKMTTDIPAGIETPDKLETSIGTLIGFDGVPDKKTTQKLYDNLDLRKKGAGYIFI